MEGGIERALPDPEDAPRNLVDVIADSPAMHGGKRERLENQQIQRPLHHIRDLCQLCPLLSERKGSMAFCSIIAQGRTHYYIGPPGCRPSAGAWICQNPDPRLPMPTSRYRRIMLDKTMRWLILAAVSASSAAAQTTDDGLMMSKKTLSAGVLYAHDSWDQYW